MSTVKKVSHPVLNQLRRSYETSDSDTVQALRDIFGLEE